MPFATIRFDSGCLFAAIAATAMVISPTALAVGNDEAKMRTASVNMIVLHAISGPECKNGKVIFSGASGDAQKWKTFFESEKDKSIHYIVDKQGAVAKSIDEDRVAWHALAHNGRSIGIELVNEGDGKDDYPKAQIDALRALVKGIRSRHPDISNKNIVRHSEIDHSTFECAGISEKRKRDPGPRFPYDEFILSLK